MSSFTFISPAKDLLILPIFSKEFALFTDFIIFLFPISLISATFTIFFPSLLYVALLCYFHFHSVFSIFKNFPWDVLFDQLCRSVLFNFHGLEVFLLLLCHWFLVCFPLWSMKILYVMSILSNLLRLMILSVVHLYLSWVHRACVLLLFKCSANICVMLVGFLPSFLFYILVDFLSGTSANCQELLTF